MKIEGPGKSSGVKGAGKTAGKGKASGADFNKMLSEADHVEARAGVSGAAGVNQIDALLALQEAGDATSDEGRKKAQRHANDLLGLLDQLKVGILTGAVSVQTLQNLTAMVANRRDKIEDPRLAEILAEIDLRAQVELAKLGR